MREPWRGLGFCPVLPNPLFCGTRLVHLGPVFPGTHGWRVYPAGLVARACGRLGKLAKESVPAVGDRDTLHKARRKQCCKKDACRNAGCRSGMGHGISPGSLGQMVKKSIAEPCHRGQALCCAKKKRPIREKGKAPREYSLLRVRQPSGPWQESRKSRRSMRW